MCLVQLQCDHDGLLRYSDDMSLCETHSRGALQNRIGLEGMRNDRWQRRRPCVMQAAWRKHRSEIEVWPVLAPGQFLKHRGIHQCRSRTQRRKTDCLWKKSSPYPLLGRFFTSFIRGTFLGSHRSDRRLSCLLLFVMEPNKRVFPDNTNPQVN